MSTFGKQSISIRKKDVAPSRSPAVATRKIRFAHKATLGQTVIDMNALVTPSLEMPTFVNASAAEIAAARLTLNRKNLSLRSSLGGMLIQDLDFVPVTATTILLIGNYASVGAADGEIFEGVIDQVPTNDLVVTEGRNIKGTVEVAVGVTTVNLGSIFKINENAAMQIGAVKIWRNGVLQARNVGNATAGVSADGNYQEIDAGNGYGTTIELNVAPAVQSDLIQFEIGFQIYNGDLQIFSDLERQQGMIQKIAADAAVAFGNPITDYLTASPSEQERRAFGDQVIDHENRIDTLESNNRHELILSAGNGFGSTGTVIRRYSTVETSVGSGFTYSDSATTGALITLNLEGIWAIHRIDLNTAGALGIGVSLNATSGELTTNVVSLSGPKVIAYHETGSSNAIQSCAGTFWASVGDVIRPHDNPGVLANSTAANRSRLRLVYMGKGR
jgi:hypothetical protein